MKKLFIVNVINKGPEEVPKEHSYWSDREIAEKVAKKYTEKMHAIMEEVRNDNSIKISEWMFADPMKTVDRIRAVDFKEAYVIEHTLDDKFLLNELFLD